jgi:hypothetical protein
MESLSWTNMDTKETHTELFIIYFVYVSLAVFSLRDILLTPGTIGYIMDHWIPYFPEQIFHKVYTVAVSSQWIAQSLGSFQAVSPDYYTRLLIAGLSLLGLGGDPISKGYFIFFISLSGISLYYFCRTLKLCTFSAFFAGGFYMFTPFLFNFVIAGGYSSVYSYALLPFGLVSFLKLTQKDEKSIKSQLIFCLFLFLLSDHIAYFTIFLIFILGYAAFDISIGKTRALKAILHGKIFLTALLIYFLAQCAWLLPFITSYPSLQQVTSRVKQIDAFRIQSRFIEFSPGLIKTFGLRGLCGSICDYFSFTLTNSQLWIPWILTSFLLVVIAFLSLILKSRDKKVMYFAFMALLGLFLAKGASPPGDFINLWAFQNVPIFGPVFRDPYHLVLIPALSFAILIGIAVDAILKRFDAIVKSMRIRTLRRLAKPLVYMCLSLLLVAYALPYLTPSFEHNLQVYNLDQNYQSLYHDFLNDKEDYKVLMLPLKEPIVPPGGTYTGSDPMLGEFGKPTLFSRMPGTSGDEKLTQFLANSLYSSSTPPIDNLGELLGMLNVKYIVFRKDFHSYYPPYSSNEAALDTLLRQQDIVFRRKYGDNIYLYENLKFLSHVYPAEQSMLVAGDLSSLLYPSGEAVFFSDQQSTDSLPSLAVDKIMIQDGNYFDYVISFLPKNYILNPVSYVSKHISDTGWINLDVFSPPDDWYQSATTESSVITTVPDTLSLPVDVLDSGGYQVWMKVLLNPTLPQQSDIVSATVKSGFVPLNDQAWAMPFTPRVNNIASLSLCLMKWGDPSEDLSGEIRTDNGSTPEGGQSIAKFDIPKAQVPNYGVWLDVGLNVQVNPGQKYWIVLNKVGSDANNTYGWAWDYQAPGVTAYSNDGANWEIRNAGSFSYQTFYNDKPLSLETTVDGVKLEKISADNTDLGRFEWVNLGLLPLSTGKHNLTISSNGGEIIVSKIVVAPQSQINQAQQQAKEYATNKSLLFLFQLDKFADSSAAVATPGLLSYIDHSTETYQLDQSGLNVQSGFMLMSDRSVAMQFVPTQESLARLSVCVRKFGNPGEDLTGEIREDNGNTPNGGGTVTTFSLLSENISDVGTWLNIDLNAAVEPGNKYWIVMNRAGSDVNNTYGWAWDMGASGMSASSLDGIDWSVSPVGSFSYQTFWFGYYNYLETKLTNITKQLEISVPSAGEYQFSISASSNSVDSGLVIRYGDATTEIKLNSTGSSFQTFTSNKVYLNEGTYKINLAISTNHGGDKVTLQSFAVENVIPKTTVSTNDSLSFEKVGSTKYVVHVHADTPFLLIFSELYDPSWEASCNGQIFDHYQINYFANGFWINETGDFDITVQLITENLYQVGLAISFSTLIILISLPIVSISSETVTHRYLKKR